MPVIGPEQQRAQRGRQPSAAHARAHADDVVAAIELRLDQYGPPVHLAEIGQSLLQRRESLLLPAAHVADHIAVAHCVIGEVAAQSQLHDIRVEPESPLASDAGMELKRQYYTGTKGVTDAGAYWVH